MSFQPDRNKERALSAPPPTCRAAGGRCQQANADSLCLPVMPPLRVGAAQPLFFIHDDCSPWAFPDGPVTSNILPNHVASHGRVMAELLRYRRPTVSFSLFCLQSASSFLNLLIRLIEGGSLPPPYLGQMQVRNERMMVRSPALSVTQWHPFRMAPPLRRTLE
jgi:hypothetical protein